MSEFRDRLDQEARRVRGRPEALQQVLDRAARRRRTRRVASGVLGLAVAATGLSIAYAAFNPEDPVAGPGSAPVPGPSVSATPTAQETPAGLPIEVLGGTESDSPAAYMAVRLASEGVFIREGGYRVLAFGNATHLPPRTLILCPPQFDHEAEQLQQAFFPGARIDVALPDQQVALRIILGKDFESQDDGGFRAFDLAEAFMGFRVLRDDQAHQFLSDHAADQYHRGEGGLELFGYTEGGYKLTGLTAAQEGEPHRGAFRVIVQIFEEGSDRTRHESLWIGPSDEGGDRFQVLDVERNE
jgi:hypothetical protein